MVSSGRIIFVPVSTHIKTVHFILCAVQPKIISDNTTRLNHYTPFKFFIDGIKVRGTDSEYDLAGS